MSDASEVVLSDLANARQEAGELREKCRLLEEYRDELQAELTASKAAHSKLEHMSHLWGVSHTRFKDAVQTALDPEAVPDDLHVPEEVLIRRIVEMRKKLEAK